MLNILFSLINQYFLYIQQFVHNSHVNRELGPGVTSPDVIDFIAWHDIRHFTLTTGKQICFSSVCTLCTSKRVIREGMSVFGFFR